MRYLKLYEEMASKLYKMISRESLLNFREGKEKLPIPISDIKKIEKLISDGIFDYCHKLSIPCTVAGPVPFEIVKNSETDIQLSPVRRRNINPTVYIVYWEDEYYIVQYSFSMGTSSYTMNYKCDQVDGVLEFIEDLNSGELVISRGDMI